MLTLAKGSVLEVLMKVEQLQPLFEMSLDTAKPAAVLTVGAGQEPNSLRDITYVIWT